MNQFLTASRTVLQPDDLYGMARAFIENNSPSAYSLFTASLTTYSNWLTLHKQVPAAYHKTLHRCINWALRSFSPGVERSLHQSPKIASALWLAKIDRSDLRVTPYSLSRLLVYHYYASIADTFGDISVKSALDGGQIVLLGLRTSSSTLANKGQGSYDDSITVIKGTGFTRETATFPACTEPGAQYSQRAALKPGGKKGERVDSRYTAVKHRKNDGVDVNADGILDAGRLVEGTYQYAEKPNGHLGARAFQVGARVQQGKKSLFRVGATQVAERDTDGDGLFSANDPSRIDPTGAATTMYIHQGGEEKNGVGNTWSAGCQTIPKNRYTAFLRQVPVNSTFYYVLINAN
jgi:hypothetical protein